MSWQGFQKNKMIPEEINSYYYWQRFGFNLLLLRRMEVGSQYRGNDGSEGKEEFSFR